MEIEDRPILLVEDSDDDAMFFQRAVQDAGRKNPVHIVRSAMEATSYLRGEGEYANRSKHPVPHLVVLDLSLPGDGGLDFLRWIRSREQFMQIPVAILGGTGSPAEQDEAQ